MRRVSCRAARLWLQTPDDLGPSKAQLLDEHLSRCSDCRRLGEWQTYIDERIRERLDAAIGSTSVRSQVLSRLSAPERPPSSSLPPQTSAHMSRRRRLWRPLVWGPVMAGVSLVALALAIVVPQLLPGPARDVVPTAGAAWHLVRPNVGYPLAVDPTRPDHLLAGAWGKVYESWDAGSSWRPLAPIPPGESVQAVAIDSRQPERYLVAVAHSLFVSSDAGRHWTTAVTSLPGARNMFLLEDTHTPGTLYLGPSILWKSVDHGRTWAPAGRGEVFAPYGIQQLAIAPNGNLVTGIWGGGVAVSRDAGKTWQRRTQGLRRNVVDVAVASDHMLWAATDTGIFFSHDGGLKWQRAYGLPRFRATTVFARPAYLLVAGDGALYRSTDGGRHWQLSMRGLPLDPYVANLVADPHHPGRVFASLNDDGIFRSDDTGQHWMPVDTDLPLKGKEDSPHSVLFRRDGALWRTDGRGTDPGVLTVDRDVTLAALSPDGVGAAYVASNDHDWAVRVVSPGAAAPTLATGSGEIERLLWSPSSTLLAIAQPGSVTISNLAHRTYRWTFPPGEQLLGWSAGGHSLMFWDSGSGRLVLRFWATGRRRLLRHQRYPAAPFPAPDGKHVAFVDAGDLHMGLWGKATGRLVSVSPSCRPLSWSDDSSRLLLACDHYLEARTPAGRLVVRAPLPSNATWVPGSDTDLLFFRGGALWRWTPPSHAYEILRHAEPVHS